MGRAPKFTRTALQAAALAIVDEAGLDGLSMRALAQALGTGPMTLYNYVEGREGLDLLVVEAIVAGAVWPDAPAAARWQDELRLAATAMWQAVRRHPNAIPLVLIRRSRAPAVFDVAETLLRPLGRAGLSGMGLLAAFRAVTALIVGMAQGELAGPLAVKAGESAAETVARFKALPRDAYPHLIEIAQAADAATPEAEFGLALGLLIRGLEASAGTRGST